MNKSLIGALAIAVTLLVGSAAHAQAQGKIAVFDAQLIYAESNAAKRAGDQLKAKQQKANQEIQSLEKPLVEKQKELASQQTLLAPDKFKSAQQELQKDYIAYRNQAAKISQDFERDQFTARKQIADAMRAAVADLAKEKGYDLVLPKAMALYAAPGVPDISQDVLTRVNAKLK